MSRRWAAKMPSLGELIRSLVPKGVRVPGGFCITAAAYYDYLKKTGLDIFIKTTLKVSTPET